MLILCSRVLRSGYTINYSCEFCFIHRMRLSFTLCNETRQNNDISFIKFNGLCVIISITHLRSWNIVDCSLLGCDDVQSSVFKMEAICSSETMVTAYKITRRHNPQDHNWHLHNAVITSNLRQTILFPLSPLKMEAVCFSETFLSTYESTRRHNPEEKHHQGHLCPPLMPH
jgi:hypothetical protein